MTTAKRITTDAEAVSVARQTAAQISSGSVERDRDRKLPWNEIELTSQVGLWAITIPKEYGGAGVSTVTLSEVFAILAEADASVAQIPQNHFANVEEIKLVGNPEQKRFFFERILQGDRLGNALIDTGGKDVLALQTRLTPVEKGYRLNGHKSYCTGALFAHWVPVRAVGPDGNLRLAVVARESEGLEVIDDWSSFGQRTTASGGVKLTEVFVPEENVFPSYLAYQYRTIRGPFSQIIHVALDAGIARAALTDTLHLLRGGGDVPVSDPFVIAEFGRLRTGLDGAEALMVRAAKAVDQAFAEPIEPLIVDAAIKVAEAKIATTEISLLTTNNLFELGGPATAAESAGLDRHWRNARVHTLHDPVRWKFHSVGNYYLNDALPPRHAWT